MVNLSPAISLKLFCAAMEQHVSGADLSTVKISEDDFVYKWQIEHEECLIQAQFVKAVGYVICKVYTPCDDVYTTHGTLEQFKKGKPLSI